MEVYGAPELLCLPHSSEYLPLCSAEQRHLCRFGTTWGGVNDDNIIIIWGGGVNYPFNMALDLIYNQTKKAISSFLKAGIHTTFKIWTDF